MSLNKVLLIGNVGQNPEVRVSQESGRKIVTFSLATSDRWKDKNSGEMREKTEWHRIVILSDGLAGIVEKYVKKGSKLYIEGTLQTRKWTDANGAEKYTTEVVLQGYNNKLDMLDAGSSSHSEFSSSKPHQDSKHNSGSGSPYDNFDSSEAVSDYSSDDNVPF